MTTVAAFLVVAQDRPPPPASGDGRSWGAVEVLLVAVAIAGLVWLITRASRRQKGRS